ncbi:ArsR/SmtB family transcription factor [Euzebya sp.]|uniref:ArsR/SmtB family transcription factor n=1 Tax=Euzebya sp. TaxID=1971409 RepID=UPI003511B342
MSALPEEPTAATSRVDDVRSRMLSDAEAHEVADLFALLADPTRTLILYALLEAGELRVSEIAEAVDAGQSTVSHALRLLRTAGVVRQRREGRHMAYRLDDAHVRLLLDLSLEHLREDGGHRRG